MIEEIFPPNKDKKTRLTLVVSKSAGEDVIREPSLKQESRPAENPSKAEKDLTEHDAIDYANQLVSLYDRDENAQLDDYLTRPQTDGGLLNILAMADREVALIRMRNLRQSHLNTMMAPDVNKSSLYELVRMIMMKPENFSHIYKLAVSKAYIQKVGLHVVK